MTDFDFSDIVVHISEPEMCVCGDIATHRNPFGPDDAAVELCEECAKEELEIARKLEEEGPDGGSVEHWPFDDELEQAIEFVPFDDYQFDTDGEAHALEGDDE